MDNEGCMKYFKMQMTFLFCLSSTSILAGAENLDMLNVGVSINKTLEWSKYFFKFSLKCLILILKS